MVHHNQNWVRLTFDANKEKTLKLKKPKLCSNRTENYTFQGVGFWKCFNSNARDIFLSILL